MTRRLTSVGATLSIATVAIWRFCDESGSKNLQVAINLKIGHKKQNSAKGIVNRVRVASLGESAQTGYPIIALPVGACDVACVDSLPSRVVCLHPEVLLIELSNSCQRVNCIKF